MEVHGDRELVNAAHYDQVRGAGLAGRGEACGQLLDRGDWLPANGDDEVAAADPGTVSWPALFDSVHEKSVTLREANGVAQPAGNLGWGQSNAEAYPTRRLSPP